MKSSRVLKGHARDIRGNLNKVYDLYSSRVVQIERDYIGPSYRKRRTLNVGCQCNIRRNVMCTCRRLEYPGTRYFSAPKQVYRYSGRRSFTDIGVGSIKALPRRRLRKVYLPETVDQSVGSVNLKPYVNRSNIPRTEDCYYDTKKTSSKCVGGIIESENISVVSKKVSPIIQKISGTTSPRIGVIKDHSKYSGDVNKHKSSIAIQADMNDLSPKPYQKQKNASSEIHNKQTSQQTTLHGDVHTVAENLKSVVMNNNTEMGKDFSSDSLVQHVHNLENPADEKQSKTSVDPMENKLEREYRKIFTSKSKEQPSIETAISDFKSASLLRRRFEALRRGMSKKESKKENISSDKTLSHASVPSRKDVSIASDPPSLEGRSYSSTKICSPHPSTNTDSKPKPKISPIKNPKGKKNKENPQASTEFGENKCESVQGMFKLWGKKFDFDANQGKNSQTISHDITQNSEQISKSESPPHMEVSKKKQGRKFFFFGKKNKEKDNKSTPYKPKKGVTTGRCEVKDGLTIKVGVNNEYPTKEAVKKTEAHIEKYEEILHNKAWLDRFITNTRESGNSVHIRWNNKMYATSSSTILELIDSVYKHTGINFRSRSEIATGESSNYHSYTKQRVHFMQQDIEAWMIPKMITERQKESTDNLYCRQNQYPKNIPIKISDHRWFVDAANGFSQKIELVLHSKPDQRSSEYVIINIPEGYFSKSSSESRAQSSDEKIYKIVEYETPDIKKVMETLHTATEHNINNIKVTVGIQNDGDKQDDGRKISNTIPTNSSLFRDVAIQGSNVFVPKRCDVIGVGIITQRDIRDVRKPVLKLEDDLTEDESVRNIIIQKKCELAESYLQDYCRNTWMPSGIDTFSWCISDTQLHSSENNSIGSYSQGDGAKSCPNMCDFQESTIVISSCKTSSCSQCIALEEVKQEDTLKSKILSKFKKKSPTEAPVSFDKRNVPKDSIEVHKKRQFYACTNQRCKWFSDKPSESSDDGTCPRSNKPCWRTPDTNKKKIPNKHVSLPGCEDMKKLVAQLSDRSLEGILSVKGAKCKEKGLRSPKHIEVLTKPTCEIPQPPCKVNCEKEKKPPCTKKNAPSCDDLLQEPSNTQMSPPCERKPPSPVRDPPLCIKPVKKPPCSACYNPPCNTSDTGITRKLSQESGISLKMSPRPSPKNSDSCLKTNPKKVANKQKKGKRCNPECAKTNKSSGRFMETPPTPPPTAYHMPRPNADICSDSSRERKTGLHLKKLPSKKNTECDSPCSGDMPGIIRLDSKENLTVRMKKETPSTEEIRECVNMKVQDEDGQTLYERVDYKRSGDGKNCIVSDLYQDPQIHRVSTPTTVQDAMVPNKSQNEICETKSDTSLDNLIEINFTLKLKRGDKGTEVNIENAGDTDIKQLNERQPLESEKDIYMLQNQADNEPINGNKKDVNIKIIIKNYSTEPEKNNENESCAVNTDDFTHRISEKLQTVSSSCNNHVEQSNFSVQRTTVGLNSSAYKCVQENKSFEYNQLENKPSKLMISSQSLTDHTVTNITISTNNRNKTSITSLKKSSTNNASNTTDMSHDETYDFNNKSDKYQTKDSDRHTTDTFDETSNDSVLYKKIRLHNRTQKKSMLKKLFQSSSAVKKPENKNKIKQIIRAILTSDSSGPEDIAGSGNKLAKELTDASLYPGYFRDTDSMNNYYELESNLSDCKEGEGKQLNPTKDNSEDSEVENDLNDKKQGCMCNTLATKLNLTLKGGPKFGCCCNQTAKAACKRKIDCDVETDSYLLNLKNNIDVETQYSKQTSNKINNANLSVQSKKQSVVIKNASVTIQKNIDYNEYPAEKCDCTDTFIPDLNEIKYRGIKSFKKETILGLSDDDILVFNSKLVENSVSKCHSRKISKPMDFEQATADILQLNETKKAVLEIYAEKIVCDEGEKIVAKLPKFDIEKANDISNYGWSQTGNKKVSRRNFVMMTINR